MHGHVRQRASALDDPVRPRGAIARSDEIKLQVRARGGQIQKAIRSLELTNLNSGSRVSLGGIISELQLRTTKKGDKWPANGNHEGKGGYVLFLDGRVEFQDVMDVFDRLKAAGVETIGIETKMPGDR